MARKMLGEWEAKDGRGQPFASKKALKEFVAAGGSVTLRDLTFFGGYGIHTTGSLEPGDSIYPIYGPNPSRGIPNKWYATIENKNGKLVVT